MYAYQTNTHESFARGQAVTLMAEGSPIGPVMVVVGAHPADKDPARVYTTWHSRDGQPQREAYPPEALCLLAELPTRNTPGVAPPIDND